MSFDLGALRDGIIQIAFTYTLPPGDELIITNDVLEDTLELPRLFGPFTIDYGLTSLLFYTGATEFGEETTDYTLAYVSMLATPTATTAGSRSTATSSRR